MPTIITVPKPCHENWDNFTPAEQGKHCQVCAKTVIDFTIWQPNEMVNYLSDKAEGETCGRFTTAQLNEPIPTAEEFAKQIYYLRISTLKKIAAIFLFAFMVGNSSCTNGNKQGKALIENGQHSTGMAVNKDYNTKNYEIDSLANNSINSIPPKPIPPDPPSIVGVCFMPYLEPRIITVTDTSSQPTNMGEPSIQQVPDAPISDSSKIEKRKIMGTPAIIKPQIIKDNLKCNTDSLAKFSDI